MAKKRRPKVPKNPLTVPMLSAWGVLFAMVGLSALSNDAGNISSLLLPMTVILGLLCMAWSIKCWMLGCISMVSNMGQTHHYFRTEEPILFHIVLGMCLLGSLGLLAYPISQLLSG